MTRSTGRPQMHNAADDGERGAKEGVAAAPQLDDLVLDAILLSGESKGSGGGREKLGVRA